MAKMVGAELGFEPVRRLTFRASHHPSVGDHHIERLAGGQKRVGAGAHALEVGEVEPDQLQASAVRRLLPHHGGGRTAFVEIADGADDLRATSGKRPRRLDPEARRRAGDQHPLAAEVDPRQHVIGGGLSSERPFHSALLLYG